MKKQIEEKQLLANATHWFEKKHGESPDDCDINFIKIWHKPEMFGKTFCVVFAPTEEIGKAYIWEQNIILRVMKNFWLLPIVFIAAVFYLFSQIDNTENLLKIGEIITGIFFCIGFFYLYMARKCKKCEKTHQWNIDVFYSGL